jgi:DNA primase
MVAVFHKILLMKCYAAPILLIFISGHLVRLKKTGKNYSACCPFHNEKSPSFSVNREKQFYHCFGCGASGNALSFVMQHEHREFIDGLEYLAQQSRYEPTRNQPTTKSSLTPTAVRYFRISRTVF